MSCHRSPGVYPFPPEWRVSRMTPSWISLSSRGTDIGSLILGYLYEQQMLEKVNLSFVSLIFIFKILWILGIASKMYQGVSMYFFCYLQALIQRSYFKMPLLKIHCILLVIFFCFLFKGKERPIAGPRLVYYRTQWRGRAETNPHT